MLTLPTLYGSLLSWAILLRLYSDWMAVALQSTSRFAPPIRVVDSRWFSAYSTTLRSRPAACSWLARLVESRWFTAYSTILILTNVMVMMCERYPMDLQLASFLDQANLVFTLLFFLEMLLKLAAFGVLT